MQSMKENCTMKNNMVMEANSGIQVNFTSDNGAMASLKVREYSSLHMEDT